MNDEIVAAVGRYLARFNFGLPPAADEDIFQIGTVTSLVAMQLLMFVEKKWCISIPTDELNRENFRTVTRIAAMVARHACARSAVDTVAAASS
jgi:acyl carrier protein